MMRMTEMYFFVCVPILLSFFSRPATCICMLCGWNCALQIAYRVRKSLFPLTNVIISMYVSHLYGINIENDTYEPTCIQWYERAYF